MCLSDSVCAFVLCLLYVCAYALCVCVCECVCVHVSLHAAHADVYTYIAWMQQMNLHAIYMYYHLCIYGRCTHSYSIYRACTFVCAHMHKLLTIENNHKKVCYAKHE